MNKLLKKTTAIIATTAIAFSTGMPAFASTENYNDTNNLLNISAIGESEELQQSLTTIEDVFRLNNTSVVNELEKGITRLENMLTKETNLEKQENIKALITTYEKFILKYKNSDAPSSLKSSSYDNYIVAAVAYFELNGYVLSAELLSHMFDDQSGRAYRPVNSDILYNTSTYQSLRNYSASTYVSSSFNGGSTTAEEDAHYAINRFDAYITSSTISIEDTYDFIDESDSEYKIPSAVGIAVSVFRAAERAGVLTPYTVLVSLNK